MTAQQPAGILGRRQLVTTLAGGALLPVLGTPYKAQAQELATAVFAGGCFWCMEPPFDKLGDGVVATTSGYCGGNEKNPTYKQVSAGKTGHAESLQVTYDPSKVSYEKLLDVFWHQINPTQVDRQFCDGGHQYRSAIFYKNEEEKKLAEETKAYWQASGKFGSRPLATEISPYKQFWPAEDYHQDFYKTNPSTYYYYRGLCGRDQYLDSIWGADREGKSAAKAQ
ncbi:peptide methionine sulfoxide reductase [Tribonema minus]|uniref:peptide-methionine (S)-S-oxide reductase n=1 Tax=Tribonema minus TaxID=303371 RepID=A0A836CIQ0_9STRA|nr:peptide methionine sulfoxide reductase [Tribonema minus]